MTRRPKQRSVKARNLVAKALREPLFRLRLKPSKKLYQRKPKHRGRYRDADLGLGADIGSNTNFGPGTDVLSGTVIL